MRVSEEVKEAFLSDHTLKEPRLYFPKLEKTIRGELIDWDSIGLRESICDSDFLEFVGCIASKFNITIRDMGEELKGQAVEAYLSAGGTDEIPIFKGVIDSVKMSPQKTYKELTAYDVLYTSGETDISGWYSRLSFPITLLELRNSLFSFLKLEQEPIELPNDAVAINEEYEPKGLRAWDVIKAICQINGTCGIINRYGRFEHRILRELTEEPGAYPGAGLYPPFYPGEYEKGEGSPEYVAHYKDVRYEEYKVKPVDRVVIRQAEEDEGVSYGTGSNTYIVQGNMFTLNLPGNVLAQIAENIYRNVEGVTYHPFTADNYGLPYIECGKDTVAYYVLNEDGETYSEKPFYVFTRELKGIQTLRDAYSAKGEQNQSVFITDLNIKIDTLKQSLGAEIQSAVEKEVAEQTYTKEEIDEKVEDAKGKNTFRIESVKALPAAWEQNVLYLIQGEVTVS